MFSWLTNWWKRGEKGRPDLHIVMFTRQGCHLCAAAWKLLTDRQAVYGFSLTVKDVDANPELSARFGDCVPVVEVNGQVRFRGHVNDVLLQRLLARG